MARTALLEVELARGASLAEDSGWEVAGHYGSASAEAREAREGCVIFDLSSFTKLRLSGRDRVRLLNAIVSNDIQRLPTHQGLVATLLNVKGRLVASMAVYALPDHLDLVLDPVLRARALPALRRYIIREDVQIADLTEDYALLELRGVPTTGLSEVLGARLDALTAGSIVTLAHLGEGAWLAGADPVSGSGYRLLVSRDRAAELWTALVESGCRPAGMQAWEMLRIEDGVPRFGRELDETVMPAEANLEYALNYEKGCYTGQEVVASLKYRGKLSRRLVGLLLPAGAGLPAPGAALRAGEAEAGRVTSSTFSAALKRPVALAFVKRDFWEPGTSLQVEDDSAATAQVAELPLVD